MFVAVTTAKREVSTLRQSVDSMINAGFRPCVFAEPDSDDALYSYYHVRFVGRLGCYRNWIRAAEFALADAQRESSDWVATAQDDALIHRDSLKLVNQVIENPPPDLGFLSLYLSKGYGIQADGSTRPPGVNHIEINKLIGCVFLVWPREVLGKVINHPFAREWRGSAIFDGKADAKTAQFYEDNPHMIKNVDTMIGHCVNDLGLKGYFLTPSAVEHIGETSTVSTRPNTGYRSAWPLADFESPLIPQVFQSCSS